MRAPVLAVVAAVLLATGAQPTPSAHASGIVSVADLGSGGRETWVFLPEDPPTCLVVFLHAEGANVPARYIGWLDYLAGAMSCAVVFPRYQLPASAAPADLGDLRAALSAGVAHVRRARFGFERLRARRDVRTVVAGVGAGGTLAFYYAANAKRWGLPSPAAIDSIFPSSGPIPGLPLMHVSLGSHVLVQVSGDERPGERDAATGLRAYLALHPPSHKSFRTVSSRPGLKANAASALLTSAAAAWTFWSPLDALIEGSS